MRSTLNAVEREMALPRRLRQWAEDPDVAPVVAHDLREAAVKLERREPTDREATDD